MNTRDLLLSWVVVAGLSTLAEAQDGTFRTWFETPESVVAGESFEVQMWASFEGDLLKPEGWFAGVQASFEVTGSVAAFQELSPLTNGLGFIQSPGTPNGTWLFDVSTSQAPGGTEFFDDSNPLPVLTFDVVTSANSTGILNIAIQPGFGHNLPLLGWTVDGIDDFIYTDDPNIALIATPTSVHVIPAPGAAALLALAGFGTKRRRR